MFATEGGVIKRLLSLVAAATLAAICAAVAAAQPPQPPRGTHGVAAKTGRPGTITVIDFGRDGKTILRVETFKAARSNSSSERGGPAPDKEGPLTAWDDEGRPGKPKAFPERKLGSASSAAGCRYVDATRDIYSDIFWWEWIGTLHHSVYWCWSYPAITSFDAGCWSDVNGGAVNSNGCSGHGWFYHWRGSSRGGHYSFRQGDWDNCILDFGCFKSIYPWVEVWVNGNGAWAQTQGG